MSRAEVAQRTADWNVTSTNNNVCRSFKYHFTCRCVLARAAMRTFTPPASAARDRPWQNRAVTVTVLSLRLLSLPLLCSVATLQVLLSSRSSVIH